MAFRIRFNRWVHPIQGTLGIWDIAQLYVYRYDEDQNPFLVNIELPLRPHFRELANRCKVNFDGDIETEWLCQALLRYGLRRIEQMIQDNFFSAEPSLDAVRLSVEETDLPFLQKLLEEKTCTYQLKEGRDLFCTAASTDDSTIVGHIGLRAVAPTSRPTCQACSLPDSDYLCSHLLHPAVDADLSLGLNAPRDLIGARCDLGRPEIKNPSRCHAGGHSCWWRVLEPDRVGPTIPTSPLALPEAIDFLDAVWRLVNIRPFFV